MSRMLNYYDAYNLVKPAETVRSLTESKRLLDEARRDINEQKVRPLVHTPSMSLTHQSVGES